MRFHLLVGSSLLVLAGCGGSGDDSGHQTSADSWQPPVNPNRITNPSPPPADVAAVVADNTRLAAKLQTSLAAAPGNFVYSPYAVSLNAAEVTAGNTLFQPSLFTLSGDRLDLAFDALDLDLGAIKGRTEKGTGLQFEQMSAVWSIYSVPAPTDPIERYYGAVVLGDDPVAQLASFQSKMTLGPALALPALAGPLDGLYATLTGLDAAWELPFDPTATALGPFTRLGGGSVDTPMMHLDGTFSVSDAGTTKAIDLPYDGARLSMLVVLPDDIAAFEKGLTSDTIDALASSLAPMNVALTLPKFDLSFQLDIRAALAAAGFTCTLPIQDAVAQSANVRVGETATVAAADTVTSTGPSAKLPAGAAFTVDRPFHFFVRDRNTGSILFAGRVADPTVH